MTKTTNKIRTPDKVIEGLKPFIGKAKVLRTSLAKDKEEQLREAFETATAAQPAG